MGRLNWDAAGHTIEDEVVYGVDANPFRLLHDTMYNHTGHKVEIWTGAGKTGTQLTETTDYTIGDEDTTLTADAGNPVYQTITVTNSAYHEATLGGPLYVWYETVGDYVDAEDTRPTVVDASADYTIRAFIGHLIVNMTTGATNRTVTLPLGSELSAGDEVEVHKVDSGTGKTTVSRSGSDTIDGVTEIDIDSQYDMARLRWTGSYWSLAEYKDHGSNAAGSWNRCADGTMRVSVHVSVPHNGDAEYTFNGSNASFPKTFASPPVTVASAWSSYWGLNENGAARILVVSDRIDYPQVKIVFAAGGISAGDAHLWYQAEGPWRA